PDYQTSDDGAATPVTMPVAPAPQIGDYEILSELGRGGMGVVYKARHKRLGRLAAIKLIRAARFVDAEDVQRFQQEAQAAAQLDHPAIVPVYEVGAVGEQHFMALAFVEG